MEMNSFELIRIQSILKISPIIGHKRKHQYSKSENFKLFKSKSLIFFFKEKGDCLFKRSEGILLYIQSK